MDYIVCTSLYNVLIEKSNHRIHRIRLLFLLYLQSHQFPLQVELNPYCIFAWKISVLRMVRDNFDLLNENGNENFVLM